MNTYRVAITETTVTTTIVAVEADHHDTAADTAYNLVVDGTAHPGAQITGSSSEYRGTSSISVEVLTDGRYIPA